MQRRSLLATGLATPALAQGEVNRLVLAFGPGAGGDGIGRLLAEAASRTALGTTVVENRAGANGNIGAGVAARARPDGRTALVAFDPVFSINPHVYPQLGFEPAALEHVALLGNFPLALLVSRDSGISDLPGLLAAARGRSLLYSSGGAGSPGHLGMEALRLRAGIAPEKLDHVPMRGNAPAIAELLAGRVQAGMLAIGGGVQMVQDGTLRAIATSGAARDPALPGVPTLIEAGWPEFSVRFAFTLSLPRGTPEAAREAWAAAARALFESPAGRARVEGFGVVAELGDAAAAQAWVAAARTRWGAVVRATGMRVD